MVVVANNHRQPAPTLAEHQQADKKVDAYRIDQIRATIMGEMKRRMRLNYSTLFDYVVGHCDRLFPVERVPFKLALERLIDDEQIKRSDHSVRVYDNNKDSEGRISLLDSSLRSELRSRGLYYVRLMGISTVMLWAAMSIFYGAVFRRSTYIYRTQLELVDLDHGPVGAGIVQAALAAIAESQSVASAN
ncbi:hypothetical protein EV174_006076, partial [Coemansia sp. RSA 2320]